MVFDFWLGLSIFILVITWKYERLIFLIQAMKKPARFPMDELVDIVIAKVKASKDNSIGKTEGISE